MTNSRSRFRPAALALAWTLLAASLAAADAGTPTLRVETVGYTVSSLERSVAFFEALDFELVATHELTGEAWERLHGVFPARMRVARLRLGDEHVELTQYLAPSGRPIPDDARSDDHTFQHVAIVVSDMEAAYRRLRANGVAHVSPGPQRLPDWNPNAGGIEAFYFKDPDGHALEVIHYPQGKGDPRWHQPGGRLFLGIDHTAIVVADTDRSIAFYERLGLAVAGASENWGPEQERLNGVFGARLRITALRAAAGPGVELLEYLAPGRGRPAPSDLRASDLAHWQTSLVAAGDVEALAQRAREAGGAWLSPGVVELSARELGYNRGASLRDPDGHGLRLLER